MSVYRRPSRGGQIVRARMDRRGLGKVIDENDSEVVVEYFVSIRHRERVVYRRSDVTHVLLAKQTRCHVYSEDEQRWCMGRIGERDQREYEVNLPDRASIWLHESHIYVRCALPPDDPTETLLLYGHETAVFHAARLKLVKSLVRQRAAARGMTGLTSSRIELFSHQVEVIRRVLQDPTQRYLLADEVGLGKTVEAGVIIRQFLLDESDGRVLVIVPPLLLDQWRRELDTKFDALRGGRVDIVSALELGRVSPRARLGLLVIDEAHRIAADAMSTDPNALERFDACRRLAHGTERLLLLSATPAASHEAQFLAMLHFLDPQTYQLNDLVRFRERVEKRQEIGGVLLTLTETARPFLLRSNLDRLTHLFPDDELLSVHVRELRALLDNNSPDLADRARAIRAIRTHVSETYRLHRRMLRNRRSALSDAIVARSSHPVRVQHDESEEALRVTEALEEWRALASASVRDEPDDSPVRRGLLSTFLLFAQAADGAPALLEHAVKYRLEEPGSDAVSQVLASEFSRDAVAPLRETPQFPNERELLTHLAHAAGAQAAAEHRIRATIDLLYGLRTRAGVLAAPKCVLFTARTSTGCLLAERLTSALGRAAVASHLAGLPREVIEEGVQRFQVNRDCFVLVCDSTGEEGRNFQFAEHLIHYDLPWHPNRLEQRVGRVDRISRRRNLTMHVLLGSDRSDALDTGWYHALADGFGLFSASLASLQFYVDAHLRGIIERAFHAGAPGLTALTATIRDQIAAEHQKLEEQAAIDEIDARDEGAESFFVELDNSDAEHGKLETAVEGWLCTVLGFSRELDSRRPGTVRYGTDRRTLVPDDVLRSRFKPFLDRFGTYDRTVAARHSSTSIYRIGDELIDALATYVSWDDRGQSFAIWREDPEWSAAEGAEWSGFRFDLIVEADTDEAWNVLADLGVSGASHQVLERRADGLLPPRTETVFLDVSLGEVIDPALLKRLRRPFSKHRSAAGQDHNLTKHRTAAIEAVVSTDAWERLCRDARDASLRIVRERPKFYQYNDDHAVVATRALNVRLAQMKLRVARGGTADVDATAHEVNLERRLGEALVRGIRAPRIRIDSAGFIVVSGRGPLSHRTSNSAPEHA